MIGSLASELVWGGEAWPGPVGYREVSVSEQEQQVGRPSMSASQCGPLLSTLEPQPAEPLFMSLKHGASLCGEFQIATAAAVFVSAEGPGC